MGGVVAGGLISVIWLSRPNSHDRLISSTSVLHHTAAISESALTTHAPITGNQVLIELYATPPQTQWWLDGVLLGNSPLSRQMPRDMRTHTLTARANDYEPRSLTVYLDRDVSLSLALDRIVAAAPDKFARPMHHSPKENAPGRGRVLDDQNPYGGPAQR